MPFRSISLVWGGFLDKGITLAGDCGKPDPGSSNVVSLKVSLIPTCAFTHACTHAHSHTSSHVHTYVHIQDRNKGGKLSIISFPSGSIVAAPPRVGTCGPAGRFQVSRVSLRKVINIPLKCVYRQVQ